MIKIRKPKNEQERKIAGYIIWSVVAIIVLLLVWNLFFKKDPAKILDNVNTEVFAVSVLAELCFMDMLYGKDKNYKAAIVVNGPTSLRIQEIANIFNAKVFYAEVGEANVVNLAKKVSEEGYTVRICGEGSNGGNITLPSSVRDPLATLFAIVTAIMPGTLMTMYTDEEKILELGSIYFKWSPA